MITSNAILLSNRDIDLSEHGIDRVSLEEAESYLAQSNPSVMGVHCHPDNYQRIIDLALKEKRKNPNKRFIVFYDQLTAGQLVETLNLIHPTLSIPFGTKGEDLQNIYQQCFDDYYQLEQSQNLIEMVNQKNEELKKLMAELEQKVKERQDQLEKSRQKNTAIERKLDILQKTLVHIYSVSRISEIEEGIVNALNEEFYIDWVKIIRPSQSQSS